MTNAASPLTICKLARQLRDALAIIHPPDVHVELPETPCETCVLLHKADKLLAPAPEETA